jgi:lipid A ethanolaminephosphotransferase
MALKLFHETGFSTLLQPGETRVTPHPARLVVAASLWVGLACNVAVWRLLAGSGEGWRATLGSVAVLAGGTAVFLGVFGWRRTLRMALSLVLIAGALFAAGAWSEHLPVSVLWQGPPRTWLPAWTSFLRWQVLALVLLLAVVPIVWLWNFPLRRLPGPSQLRCNIAGAMLAGLILGAGLYLLR